jgi:hypothetical protein
MRAAGAAAVLAAPLVNPAGWRLYLVPFTLARLVGRPSIPNPEWISPSPADLPSLWVAAALALGVLAVAERRPVRWALMLGVTALALRYVRNAGLAFVLLPLAAAPALARLEARLDPADRAGRHRPGARLAAATAISLLIAGGFVLVSPHPLAPGLSPVRYPISAVDFMQEHGLAEERCYNDVVFGGYLIGRLFPPRQVFLDDRNEIHERLLEEIHGILGRSDVAAWQAMLGRYRITAALVRYSEPIEVRAPDGSVLGHRGFSALWFPARTWALVYWDDTAMLLVRRMPGDAARERLLARHEYRLIRPDDLEHLGRMLAAGRLTRAQLATELRRKLDQDPTCRRALDLAELVLGAR